MSSQGSTRLSQMQQRFQQKQVQELTVQKKAEIFNNFDLNEPKVLASSLGAGKVRQMFDRHRGIDKSYLLQPIQHASAPATLVKKSVAPTKPARDTKISGYNSKIVVPPLSKPSYQDVNGNNKFASEIRSPLKPLASTVRPKEIRLSGTKSVTSSQSSSGKSISNGNQIKSPTRSMNSGSTTPGSSGSTRTFTTTTRAVIERSSPSPVHDDPVPEGLLKCQYCARNFAEDRIEKHQVICLKTKNRKKRVYDGSKARVEGTEAASFVLKQTKTGARKVQPIAAPAKKENNWRAKHEEFIAAIRAAKDVKTHLAKGGKLSDLPPPPPSVNADYVQCQHCSRRFNQAAAERHIPKCASMLHNKPAKKQITPARKR